MTNEPASSTALHVSYTRLDPHQPLGDDVLAALVFGKNASAPDDPRCLRVGLEPLAGVGLAEVWRGNGRVRLGRDGPIRTCDDGNVLIGWLDVAEDGLGGMAATAEAAYRKLLAFHAASAYPHLWRIWNFVTAINEGAGDEERYRLFSLGRARAFTAEHAANPGLGYPAATAVGKPDGPRTLQVCWMAGREPGTMLENPRQVAAYQYPRQYGPAAPSFSRAMRIPPATLLISGTASIVGHASMHVGDAAAQLEETLSNLAALLERARHDGLIASTRLGADSLLKVYLRPGTDPTTVEQGLRARFGSDFQVVILAAEICRTELLLEVEAVQCVSATTR